MRLHHDLVFFFRSLLGLPRHAVDGPGRTKGAKRIRLIETGKSSVIAADVDNSIISDGGDRLCKDALEAEPGNGEGSGEGCERLIG